MRSILVTGVVLSVLAGISTPVNAALYQVAFTQNGLGSSGPDWFGTFTAPDSGNPQLSDFSATVNGNTYTSRSTIYGPITFYNNLVSWPALSLIGFAFDQDLVVAPNVQTILQLYTYSPDGIVVNNIWALSNCSTVLCGGGATLGTYEITQMATPIPLPGTLSLIAIALAGLGVCTRRWVAH